MSRMQPEVQMDCGKEKKKRLKNLNRNEPGGDRVEVREKNWWQKKSGHASNHGWELTQGKEEAEENE